MCKAFYSFLYSILCNWFSEKMSFSMLGVLCKEIYELFYIQYYVYSIIYISFKQIGSLHLLDSWICIRFNIFNNLIYQTDIVLDRAAITAKNGLNMCWQLKGFATSTGHS